MDPFSPDKAYEKLYRQIKGASDMFAAEWLKLSPKQEDTDKMAEAFRTLHSTLKLYKVW
jgi:hypothetical protein